MSQAGEKKARSNRGGFRPGSGRKPAGYITSDRGEADFARELLRTLMRDESQPMALRARCAMAVLHEYRRTTPQARIRQRLAVPAPAISGPINV